MTRASSPERSTRRAGRPRDPAADQAILATALRLLRDQGYDAMSVEGVALAAGVGKTTIYRRYPGKRELVVAAISSLAASLDPIPDLGDPGEELLRFARQTADVLGSGGLGFSMIGTLLVRERDDPELLELFRIHVIRPRMAQAAELFRRGIDRGRIRPDLSVETATHLLAGALFARHLTTRPPDEVPLEVAVETLWSGIASPIEAPERQPLSPRRVKTARRVSRAAPPTSSSDR
jgi:AcrR family transcriptional regulator